MELGESKWQDANQNMIFLLLKVWQAQGFSTNLWTRKQSSRKKLQTMLPDERMNEAFFSNECEIDTYIWHLSNNHRSA